LAKANNISYLNLADVIRSLPRSLPDLTESGMIVEVPPHQSSNFLTLFTKLCRRLHDAGAPHSVVVLPDLRAQTQKASWVQLWNQQKEPPFTFHRLCSCHFGSTTHSEVLYGGNVVIDTPLCTKVSNNGHHAKGRATLVNTVVSTLIEKCHGVSKSAPPPAAAGARAGPDLNARSRANFIESSNAQVCPVKVEGTTAYPTDAKVKEKEKKKKEKEQGVERKVKKKPKVIEDHYDDCGDDLTSLGPDDPSPGVSGVVLPLYSTFLDEWSAAEIQDRAKAWPLIIPKTREDVAKAVLHKGERGRYMGPQQDSPCPACSLFRAIDCHTHSRKEGECRYPYNSPFIPSCAACWNCLPELNALHTRDSGCRYEPGRQSRRNKGLDAPPAPSRSRPHEVQPPVHDEPTSTRRPFGAEDELDNVGREVAEPDRKGAAGKTGSPHVHKKPIGGDDSDENSDDPDMELPEAGRKPRAQRKKVQDAAVGPPAEDDWRGFNIGRVVRLLRTTNEAVLRLQLRKLHVRWWHSSTLAMTRLLQRVGVSDTALELIKDIVDSCPVCRQWVRPSPHNQVGINLPDTFNDQVEMDLLFSCQACDFSHGRPVHKMACSNDCPQQGK